MREDRFGFFGYFLILRGGSLPDLLDLRFADCFFVAQAYFCCLVPRLTLLFCADLQLVARSDQGDASVGLFKRRRYF